MKVQRLVFCDEQSRRGSKPSFASYHLSVCSPPAMACCALLQALFNGCLTTETRKDCEEQSLFEARSCPTTRDLEADLLKVGTTRALLLNVVFGTRHAGMVTLVGRDLTL